MVRAFLDSTYTKLIVGGIIAFGAVVGGVYVGYAVIGSQGEGGGEAIPTSMPPSDAIALRFAAGDAFPLEEYSDQSGAVGSFEELLRDKETILILGSTTCENCLDLLKYAHETMPS